jgi:hypothetical protein
MSKFLFHDIKNDTHNLWRTLVLPMFCWQLGQLESMHKMSGFRQKSS